MLGYNRMTGYNVARYNAEGSEIQKADTITLTEGTVAKNSKKTLVELAVLAGTIAKQQNKSVTETIKLDLWLSVDRDDSNLWGD